MIRKAQIADLPAVWELAGRLHEKSVYRDIPRDLATFAKSMGHCVNSALGFAMVAERNGKITGFCLGLAVQLFFSPKRSASDLVTYSESPGDGLRLIRAFKEWAWNVPGVVEVTMAQSSGIDVERTGKLYERAGFERVGELFMAVKPVASEQEEAA